SSRRRHTRSDRDWSSDVCSSDLHQNQCTDENNFRREREAPPHAPLKSAIRIPQSETCSITLACRVVARPVRIRQVHKDPPSPRRSEERRVGKECTSGRATVQLKK